MTRTSLNAAFALSVLALLSATGCGSDGNSDADASADVAEDAEDSSDASDAADDTADDTALGNEVVDGTDTRVDEVALPATYADRLDALTALLPKDTRGVLAVDLATLLAGNSAADVISLLAGTGGHPALSEHFVAIDRLATGIDLPGAMTSALLVQTSDASDGLMLLATVRGHVLSDVATTPAPAQDGTYKGETEIDLYLNARGDQLALLPGGLLVAGSPRAVASVLDVASAAADSNASTLTPFLVTLRSKFPLSFAYGMPAMFGAGGPPTSPPTLTDAEVVSGVLDLANGMLFGEVAFHTARAESFVSAYNALNKHAYATGGEPPIDIALAVAEPVVGELGQVVVTVGAVPIDPSPAALEASRNTLKKLFIGMQAHAYAESVDGTEDANPALLDLVLQSEADGATPPSPGAVFIRWDFKDQAAIEAFEQNELPAGFTLARCQFFESDDPAGEYFVALNLYNAGGSSIVSGARAEWDVFVNPPAGADPDAGSRPRFMVVDALAQAVSADPVNLITTAEPLSHSFVGDNVVTTVARLDEGVEVPVFASSFPKPDPASATVARFTRQLATSNDFIYWGHGVYDRIFYNATTFNHDAYFADASQLVITDNSRWAQYLAPTVKDVVYYANTLEFVASPMANLDSDFLDIAPAWLAELVAFRDNGHQLALMRAGVERLFRGESDALVAMRIDNATPSTVYAFAVEDPAGLAAAIELPEGHSLAPTAIFDGGDPLMFLTLSVYAVADAPEGMRAEWSVTVDDGSGRPRTLVIDRQTEDAALDPERFLNVPTDVRHALSDSTMRTQLASATVAFDASLETADAATRPLALDWIEAGDELCSASGVCDKRYYNAQTLDVPVKQPTAVSIDVMETPWNPFITKAPAAVFYRDTPQDYALKRWHNLDVIVEQLPFTGLADPSHAISGTGTLVGRDTDVVDSSYAYTGDAILSGQSLSFTIDQEITNLLGVANVFTSGTLDIATGVGTQTVTGCLGPALMCSGIAEGTTSLYAPQDVDASNPDAITWSVDVVVDVGGTFGLADSTSSLIATKLP